MDSDLTLRIILERPPEGVDYGLQKGRGTHYEVVQKQRSTGEDLRFELTAQAKPGGSNRALYFSGPFVQGTPGQQFVYIDIGTYAGQGDSCWSRRLKIPLTGITTDTVNAEAVLEARVPGTGKDGGPSCATAKPIGGWQPRRK